MKITIETGTEHREIRIPDGLLFNSVSLWLIQSAIKKSSPVDLGKLNGRTRRAVLAEIRKVRKQYGSWKLVDIESASGEMVSITI